MQATKEQLQGLIGAKIVAIDEFTGSYDKSGFILHFQKAGSIFLTSLTAQDFEFPSEEEMEKKTFVK